MYHVANIFPYKGIINQILYTQVEEEILPIEKRVIPCSCWVNNSIYRKKKVSNFFLQKKFKELLVKNRISKQDDITISEKDLTPLSAFCTVYPKNFKVEI